MGIIAIMSHTLLHKNMIFIIFFVFSLTPNVALTAVFYHEKPDDFSNGVVKIMIIRSNENRSAIIISCFPGSSLNIQFHTDGTIFPDRVGRNSMFSSITHKFDKSGEAETSDWKMDLMKYEDAWYLGDEYEFAEWTGKANFLNLRLNKRNDISKYRLAGTAAHIKKILSACPRK